MKQVWRPFSNPQLLVSKVFRARASFLSNNPSTRTLYSGRYSYGLRGLLKANALLKQGCSWKIGNGLSTPAGSARWVNGCIPEFKPGISLPNLAPHNVIFFINHQTMGWDTAKVVASFVPADASSILVLEAPNTAQEDFCYWAGTSSGKYSVKTGYAMLQQQLYSTSTHSATDSFWKILWSLPLQPKWKLFLWKLLHRALAIKVELYRRGVPIQDVFCDLCRSEPEDLQHLFRMCVTARSVWRGGCLGIHSEFNGDLSLSDWIQYYIRLFISLDGPSSTRLGAFVGTLWTLWLSRNSRIFRDSSASRPFDSLLAEVMDNHSIFVNSEAPASSPNEAGVVAGDSSPPGFYMAQLGRPPGEPFAFSSSRWLMV
ncbi:uncharacterized protein LOC110731898 [Chenopodium quinoa]|uniref:uncharacterized protein LOC110731898 n=1 Tax=Chenopodium quinoa TaxID=63459 RepID=UPI000B76F796|nr:uncharacterized protein LOC110731898 [Chenopodium quinoa]